MLLVALACTPSPGATASAATAKPLSRSTLTTYRWARARMKIAQSVGLLPDTWLTGDPGKPITRGAFVNALALLEEHVAQANQGYGYGGTSDTSSDADPYDSLDFSTDQTQDTGPVSQFDTLTTGARLRDVAATSMAAKAVKLGWLAPINHRFAARAPLTADEAARGIVGALGLQSTATTFGRTLKSYGGKGYLAASQIIVRRLGLRYNNLQGTEQMEISPRQSLPTAHAAFMLAGAYQASSWEMSSAQDYAQFELPALTTTQRKLIRRGMQLIGYPYVWAGESEYSGSGQPQGIPGFDCSGFVTRVTRSAGLNSHQISLFASRTSFAMSAEHKQRHYDADTLRPGDVLFFSSNSSTPQRKRRPSDNFHTGMYLGNGWFIHSTGSNDGVSINKLDGWWRDSFSWASRVLH